MITQILDELAKQFNKESSLEATKIKALLQSALQKMDVVSRDEFDAQTAVLQRTRERLQILEKQITDLEAQVK